jgi:hypothetical protein
MHASGLHLQTPKSSVPSSKDLQKMRLILVFLLGIASLCCWQSHAFLWPAQRSPAARRAALCHLHPEVCAWDAGDIPPHANQVPEAARAVWDLLWVEATDVLLSNLPEATIDDLAPVTELLQLLKSTPGADGPQRSREKLYPLLQNLRSEIIHRSEKGVRPQTKEAKEPFTPFWGFAPKFHGYAKVNASTPIPLNVSSRCFEKVSVSASLAQVGDSWTAQVVVEASMQKELLCADRLHFSLASATHTLEVDSAGIYQFPFDVTLSLLSPALTWDLNYKGVRVYSFDSPAIIRALDLLCTLLLFEPAITGKIEGFAAQWNVDYISNYTKLKPFPTARNASIGGVVPLTPGVDIRSGDLFAKMDLNGIGTTEMLGQGTTSGHVAVALEAPNGTMMVCEAVKSGIRCMTYDAWIHLMADGNNAIALVPLNRSFSDNFNLTAAWEVVNRVLGNEYGFHNFIFGWIDTAQLNYPCLPPDFDRCLVWEHFEQFFFGLDEILPSLVNKFVGEALNHRAKTQGLNFANVLYQGYLNTGLDSADLMAVVEQDQWTYSITRKGVNGTFQGPSMVCSTLGCNILRAAGVFQEIDGELQCAEIDVWDMFSLKIFDQHRMAQGRPNACREADPDNELCQLSGTWTFHLLTDVNTRPMARNISFHCASQGPHPYNREGCFSP